MPALDDNRRKWAGHDWAHGGHKWSPGGTAAGTAMMWWRAIRPRIHTHLPTGSLLEIAPGYGRWTAYLLAECEQLTGVDLTPQCVETCRERFAGAHAQFAVNDGESLPMVADASIDFAFSLDSLVHVEGPQVRRYLQELARTLRPGATAFLHHSNLGAYADARSATIPPWIVHRHWRATSMSARLFREACRDAGLVCVTQELINWIGRDAVIDRYKVPAARIPLTDCLSVCMRPRDGAGAETRVLCNRRFVEEWREMIALSRHYGEAPDAGPDVLRETSDAPPPAGRVRDRWIEHARVAVASRVFERRDPLAPAIRRGRCPECGGALSRTTNRSRCAVCGTAWTLR